MPLQGDQKRAYQAKWTRERRSAWIRDNGPCVHCGGDEDLQVDHVVRRKDSGGLRPALIWSRRKEIRDVELAKCQVLCRQCHDVKSRDEMRQRQHGSTMYRNGCRCEECTESQRIRQIKYRASRY